MAQLTEDECEALWQSLLSEGVTPVCAACQEPAQERDYCAGCGLYIHDACDPYVEIDHAD